MSLDETQLTAKMRDVWNCPECVSKKPVSKKNDNTPIRNVNTSRGNKRPALNSPPTDNSRASMSRDDIREILEVMTKNMDDNFAKMRQNMTSALDEQLKPIRAELSQMNDSMNFISNQYEDLKKVHEASQLRVTELEKQSVELKATVEDLTLRINQVEQQSRQNNVELQCVPEDKNENIMQIIHQLGKTIGCRLNDNDVLNCTRTAKVNRSSTRPRSIVVQLASPRLRDQLLASTISFNKANPQNKLNSSHLGLSGNITPIFVTEHLSPSNKVLHAAARRAAKDKGYKYVWIRSGKIFLRKSDDTEFILVKNMDMLKNIK
ncbi:uncharacterized protein LOC113234605 [Hyposmocoma kahamanoa]|uniref:uncharacterized protein LOC113234605 n=1 Tax=Hyposmocoma kahamanoa TaxID=1477025 RepID=UPI000E6D8648|nr:uncharacterized protein LOC113234605 [Hyposmocoma kahamanoa]